MEKRGGVIETGLKRGAYFVVSVSVRTRETCLTGFPCCGFDGDITNFLLRALRLSPFLVVKRGSPCSLPPLLPAVVGAAGVEVK